MKKTIIKELVIETIIFFILAFLMALLWKHNLILTAIYIMGFLIALIYWKDKTDIRLFIFVTIFFQIGEIICVQFGVWTYNNPSYMNIPMWLPLSWGYTAVIVRRLAKTLSKI